MASSRRVHREDGRLLGTVIAAYDVTELVEAIEVREEFLDDGVHMELAHSRSPRSSATRKRSSTSSGRAKTLASTPGWRRSCATPTRCSKRVSELLTLPNSQMQLDSRRWTWHPSSRVPSTVRRGGRACRYRIADRRVPDLSSRRTRCACQRRWCKNPRRERDEIHRARGRVTISVRRRGDEETVDLSGGHRHRNDRRRSTARVRPLLSSAGRARRRHPRNRRRHVHREEDRRRAHGGRSRSRAPRGGDDGDVSVADARPSRARFSQRARRWCPPTPSAARCRSPGIRIRRTRSCP